MMNKKKSIILLSILLLFILIIAITVACFTIPLVVGYYQNSFENVEPVERSEPYVLPEKDESEIQQNLLSDDEIEETSDAFVDNDKEDASLSSDQGTNSGLDKHYNYMTSFTETENAINVFGKTPIYKVEQKDPAVINILVMGTDSRDVSRERGRSDSMIVVSYNRKKGEIKMISILRDSLVPIEGYGWNRINAAYSFDGVGLAINTVNQLFDLDIQHFVVIDFTGARDFINHVGGVDITISEKEAAFYSQYSGELIEPGLCHMDGALAMTHMRTRKIDSDFGRTERQREVIEALANKIVAKKSVSEVYDLANYAFKLVKTNILLTDLFPIIASVATNKSGLSIESQSVPYDDSYVYESYSGMSVISFDIEDAKNRMNKFLYSE